MATWTRAASRPGLASWIGVPDGTTGAVSPARSGSTSSCRRIVPLEDSEDLVPVEGVGLGRGMAGSDDDRPDAELVGPPARGGAGDELHAGQVEAGSARSRGDVG